MSWFLPSTHVLLFFINVVLTLSTRKVIKCNRMSTTSISFKSLWSGEMYNVLQIFFFSLPVYSRIVRTHEISKSRDFRLVFRKLSLSIWSTRWLSQWNFNFQLLGVGKRNLTTLNTHWGVIEMWKILKYYLPAVRRQWRRIFTLQK